MPMRFASVTTQSRDFTMLIAVSVVSLVFAGCSSSTAPKSTGMSGLWAANTGVGSLVLYTTAQLGGSTSAAAATAIRTSGGAGTFGLAFDSHGNLWLTNYNNNTIVEYTAAQLKASGTPTPAVTIGTGSNQPTGVAFDAHGNLWVANAGSSTVVEYSASQLSASGSPTPAVTIGSTGGSLFFPNGIAFDAHGNLWVANVNGSTLVEFSPGQLATSGSPTPTVTLTSGSIVEPFMIAFDAGGNLWFNNPNVDNTLAELSPSQLASSGSVIPVVTLTPPANSLSSPAGLAFDGGGNLWVADSFQNTMVEFTASQLVVSGSPTPGVTISGSSLNQPLGLAFNPRVSGLPIE
jgi:sugar lactone lactonase YvrE